MACLSLSLETVALCITRLPPSAHARTRVPVSASSVWLSAPLAGFLQTSGMDDLDVDFLDAYRAACDDLDVDPLAVPDLVQLILALVGPDSAPAAFQ